MMHNFCMGMHKKAEICSFHTCASVRFELKLSKLGAALGARQPKEIQVGAAACDERPREIARQIQPVASIRIARDRR
jgi:hypothetical protein